MTLRSSHREARRALRSSHREARRAEAIPLVREPEPEDEPGPLVALGRPPRPRVDHVVPAEEGEPYPPAGGGVPGVGGLTIQVDPAAIRECEHPLLARHDEPDPGERQPELGGAVE